MKVYSPFIKVKNTLDCCNFYYPLGTLPPLIGVGACVSIQFGVLEIVKRFFMVIF